MKNKSSIIVALFTVMMLVSIAPASAQNADANANAKSNGTVEIIALYIPDFVAFKPAEGKVLENWEVWLIPEIGKDIRSFLTKGIKLNIKMDNNKMKASATDKSEIRALFNIQDGIFKASKVKFVIDGKEMLYNLTTEAWE